MLPRRSSILSCTKKKKLAIWPQYAKHWLASKTDPHAQVNLLGFESAWHHMLVNWSKSSQITWVCGLVLMQANDSHTLVIWPAFFLSVKCPGHFELIRRRNKSKRRMVCGISRFPMVITFSIVEMGIRKKHWKVFILKFFFIVFCHYCVMKDHLSFL